MLRRSLRASSGERGSSEHVSTGNFYLPSFEPPAFIFALISTPQFPKLRELTSSLDEIRRALAGSKSVELSEDGSKVRPVLPKQPAVVIIRDVPAGATEEEVSAIFAVEGAFKPTSLK